MASQPPVPHEDSRSALSEPLDPATPSEEKRSPRKWKLPAWLPKLDPRPWNRVPRSWKVRLPSLGPGTRPKEGNAGAADAEPVLAEYELRSVGPPPPPPADVGIVPRAPSPDGAGPRAAGTAHPQHREGKSERSSAPEHEDPAAAPFVTPGHHRRATDEAETASPEGERAEQKLTFTDREFMRAFRRLVQDTVPRAGGRHQREDAPGLFTVQMATLFLLVANAVFACQYIAAGSFGEISQAYRILELLVPALLGTALVAYLDEAREFILRISRSRLTTGIAAVFLAGLCAPHLVDYRVPVVVSEGVEVMVPGWDDPLTEASGYLPARNFDTLTIIVRDDLADSPHPGEVVVDTLKLTRWALVRSGTPLRYLRRKWRHYQLFLAPTYPITVDADSPGGELVVEGRFPELYLSGKMRERRENRRFALDSGRVWLPVRPIAGFDNVDLPPGTYRMRLYSRQRDCSRRLPGPYTVSRSDTAMIHFLGVPCEP